MPWDLGATLLSVSGQRSRRASRHSLAARIPTDCATGRQRAGYRPTGPRRAASIVAISIFLIVIIASNARFAAARSESVVASISTRGVICQDRPHLSLHHPHALSAPPFPTIAFQ